MLATQRPVSGSSGGQGSLRAILAELEHQSRAPSSSEDGLRQRLLVLARRLGRVQALGDEYAGISLSEHVRVILRGRAGTV